MSITDLIFEHNVAIRQCFGYLINRDWNNLKETLKMIKNIETKISQYHINKTIGGEHE